MIDEGGKKIFLIPEKRSIIFPSSGEEERRIRINVRQAFSAFAEDEQSRTARMVPPCLWKLRR